MVQRILNLLQLIRIIRERGNWPLIRRSRHQLFDFILCRNDFNPQPLWKLPVYWLGWLKGLDVLVWRLETFGFLFQPDATEEDRSRLNRFL